MPRNLINCFLFFGLGKSLIAHTLESDPGQQHALKMSQ